ncbi:hypothetical protein ED28_16655 [[Pantoea] beijingensis]|uniref:Lysozyme inhibitor LprI-like N-terminal domain-containing protein n=1 Tax=[Pantoea] beijingensis TaxID=1324864 RepID=A0A443IAZ6_9GAMM|nr:MULTISPECIES: lysozyme inhibitor LprI family protein [Erwiniaceae]RWR01077.1 hypothetical protein ED28_16655 [[Pantoea] beijingensis]
MKNTLLAICLLLPFGAMAQKAPAASTQIDTALQSCLNKETTTKDMSQCYATATQAWDKEMNTQYNALIAKLDSNQQKLMRNAQRDWLKYRDSMANASTTWLSQSQGTISSVTAASQQLVVVKSQALVLKSLKDAGCVDPDGCK